MLKVMSITVVFVAAVIWSAMNSPTSAQQKNGDICRTPEGRHGTWREGNVLREGFCFTLPSVVLEHESFKERIKKFEEQPKSQGRQNVPH